MKSHYRTAAEFLRDIDALVANRRTVGADGSSLARKDITGTEPKTSRAKLHYTAPRPLRVKP